VGGLVEEGEERAGGRGGGRGSTGNFFGCQTDAIFSLPVELQTVIL